MGNFSATSARFGIWSSVARKPALGVYDQDPFGQGEAVDVRTALRSYTIWSARQMFLEDEIGSLEPGKYADIIAVRGDVLRNIALLGRVDVVIRHGIRHK